MLGPLLALVLASAPLQDTAHVVLVATTDVHGHATARDYAAGTPFPGGLTRAATVIDSLRKVYPGQVVVVDVGDFIEGDAFASYFATVEVRDPHPVLEALNAIGYDVGTPGNHDFDFGVPFLRRALASAAFPYVSANIRMLPSDTFLLPPYATLRRGPVRIAVTGFTTPGVMVWDRDKVRGQVRVEPVARQAARILAEMRKDADLSIALVHSGMDGPSSYDTTGVGPEHVAASLAGLSSPPDVVVVGHSHREMRDSVINGVHFVQPKPSAQSLSVSRIDLVPAGSGWKVARVRAELVPLEKVTPSPRLVTRLAAADRAVRRWVETPLGDVLAATSTQLARVEPTPLIQFINEVQRRRAGTQLAATPAFSTRVDLPVGPLTIAQMVGLYPHENTLRGIRVSGAALTAYLEQSARYWTLGPGGALRTNDSVPGYNDDMVLGATYDVDVTRPVGDRIRNLAVGGRRVGVTDSFTLAINSYRESGGGGFDMLKGAPVVYDRGESIRDLLIDAARAQGGFDPAKYRERNWRLLPLDAYDEARRLFGAPPVARRAPDVARAPGDTVLLRVLTINDLHGALEPRTYEWSNGHAVGGVAAIKAHMDSLEARCGCPTIRVDAGDQMQGTLVSNVGHGRATVAALSALGIRAAAVGNHDLDWGVDTLRARMAEATYPWLLANVVDSATGRPPAWAVPSAVVQVGARRVGLVGYLTRDTPRTVPAELLHGLQFPGGRAPIEAALAAVRAQRPDFILLLAHAGDTCDATGTTCSGETLDLVHEAGPRLADLIVSGHTHRRIVDSLSGVPIVQARSSGTAIGVIDFIRLADGRRTVRMDVITPYVDDVTPDAALAALVERERAPARALGDRVVATVKLPLATPPSEDGQYAIGNLIADAQRNAGRADVAIMQNGGIRAPGLPAGPVTYAQAFSVQPLGSGIVVLELPGSVLRQALEQTVVGGRIAAHVSGLAFRYAPSRRPGSRITDVRLDDGRKLDDRRTYTLAVNDVLAAGGGGYTMLPSQKRIRAAGTDLDVLIDYMRKLSQPLEASSAPRITVVGD